MNNQLSNVHDFMSAFGQEVHDKPLTNPPYHLRLLRARLILEEAFECVNALGFDVHSPESYDQDCKDLDHYKDNRICSHEHEDVEFVMVDSQTYDQEKTLDGLVDLDYVGHKGTALALGLASCLDEADAEVHRSNMSKCWTREEASELPEAGGFELRLLPNGLFRVSLDGKILKPPSYSRANLTSILTKANG